MSRSSFDVWNNHGHLLRVEYVMFFPAESYLNVHACALILNHCCFPCWSSGSMLQQLPRLIKGWPARGRHDQVIRRLLMRCEHSCMPTCIRTRRVTTSWVLCRRDFSRIGVKRTRGWVGYCAVYNHSSVSRYVEQQIVTRALIMSKDLSVCRYVIRRELLTNVK